MSDSTEQLTLLLHKDWTQLKGTPGLCDLVGDRRGDRQVTVSLGTTPRLCDLGGDRQVTVSLGTTSARAIGFLATVFIPLILLAYILLTLVGGVLRLSQWKIGETAGQGTPCFFYSSRQDGVLEVLSGLVSGVACLGLAGGVSILVYANLGASYLRFALWWGRRNYDVTFWGVAGGIIKAIADRGAVGGSIVSILQVPILAGLDFLILIAGRGRTGVFRAFYTLNAVALALSYTSSFATGNLCNVRNEAGTVSALVLDFCGDLAQTGYLMAVLKIAIAKIQRTFAPALRYGVSSHVHVSECAPGAWATATLDPDYITVTPAESLESSAGPIPTAQRQGLAKSITFRFPDGAFRTQLLCWSVVPLLWVALSISEVLVEMARTKLHITARCWTRKPFPFSSKISIASAALAAVAVVFLAGLIVRHGLGRLSIRWAAFWFRRNWTLLLLCFPRGLNEFRPNIPASEGVSTLIKYAVLLPVAISTSDLIALLKPPRLFLFCYGFFIVGQVLIQFTNYVNGLALDNPCESGYDAHAPFVARSMMSILLGKAQNAVLLIFSIHYLGALSEKFFVGMHVPLVRLSTKGRFFTVSSVSASVV